MWYNETMKNLQKGFIVPVLLLIIALLAIGGGAYIYNQKKTSKVSVNESTTPARDIAIADAPRVFSTPTTSATSNWKTYSSAKYGYSFNYPQKLSLTSSADEIYLLHNINFDNYAGGCDLKGDAPLSKTLNDFNLSFKIVSGQVNPPYVDGTYSQGVLNGKWSYMGAEGCGQTSYYFPITGNRTLVVAKSEVQILSPVVSAEVKAKVLAVPGVISQEESKVIFDQILSSFKFAK